MSLNTLAICICIYTVKRGCSDQLTALAFQTGIGGCELKMDVLVTTLFRQGQRGVYDVSHNTISVAFHQRNVGYIYIML